MPNIDPRPVAIGPDDKIVLVQFSFANHNGALDSLVENPRETPEERRRRKSRSDGVQIIPETMDVSLAGFAWQLEQAGFQLAEASRKERLHGDRDAVYWFARFAFIRRTYREHVPEAFAAWRDASRQALSRLVYEAMWRVRAYRNPLSEHGVITTGAHALSINCEARTPLFCPDGSPISARRRNAFGIKTGSPVAIAPRHRLQLKDAWLGLILTDAALHAMDDP